MSFPVLGVVSPDYTKTLLGMSARGDAKKQASPNMG
jgi:hypothetical protein